MYVLDSYIAQQVNSDELVEILLPEDKLQYTDTHHAGRNHAMKRSHRHMGT